MTPFLARIPKQTPGKIRIYRTPHFPISTGDYFFPGEFYGNKNMENKNLNGGETDLDDGGRPGHSGELSSSHNARIWSTFSNFPRSPEMITMIRRVHLAGKWRNWSNVSIPQLPPCRFSETGEFSGSSKEHSSYSTRRGKASGLNYYFDVMSVIALLSLPSYVRVYGHKK